MFLLLFLPKTIANLIIRMLACTKNFEQGRTMNYADSGTKGLPIKRTRTVIQSDFCPGSLHIGVALLYVMVMLYWFIKLVLNLQVACNDVITFGCIQVDCFSIYGSCPFFSFLFPPSILCWLSALTRKCLRFSTTVFFVVWLLVHSIGEAF